MAKHIFLTGEKQVGKSTLLKKALSGYSGKIGVFYTVRTNAFLKDAYSVHIYSVYEKPIPSESNLLFICGKVEDNTEQRFDYLGCKAFEQNKNCDLIVMDKLRRHEANTKLFQQAVQKQLDKEIPIIGVLQEPAEANWPEITAHPNVKILTVTKENRDDPMLIKTIMSAILF